jgi:pyroglutamyl-peptidase
LVTGFTPFGGDSVNPSGDIATRLNGDIVGGRMVRGCALPVTVDWALALIEDHFPQCGGVIAMGVSNRPTFSVEAAAWNEADYPQPDHRGEQRIGRLAEKGPHSLCTPFEAQGIVDSMIEQGFSVEISHDPGRYVCNAFYYGVLAREVPCLFFHLPPCEGMLAAAKIEGPLVSLERMEETVRALLQTLSASEFMLARP